MLVLEILLCAHFSQWASHKGTPGQVPCQCLQPPPGEWQVEGDRWIQVCPHPGLYSKGMHPSWYIYSTSITHAGSLQYLILGYTVLTLYCIWMPHADLIFFYAHHPLHECLLLQMLEIHERFECGIPVIIEGETGVGKTALVEMLSVLWNQSLLGDWRLLRERFLELLKENCFCELNGYKGVHFMYMHYNNLHCITVYGRIPSP